ncbi:MAG: mxaJ protein [Acidobacteriota bacterium]|jgi:quinoprotein dehydrogenase-associated probable ABC transporter substrate-binding protein|nr:mxaJ protein [Acidobacteriota bacterium]
MSSPCRNVGALGAARAARVLCLICAAMIPSACAKTAQMEEARRVEWQPPQTLQPTAPPSEAWREQHVLKVCADPNNLPFSNRRGEGFENKIAQLVAKDLHARVEYTWWAQRRGFFRNTLKSGACDLVVGVPAGFEMALTTAPYYRSTYVFISRKSSKLDIASFDDPKLRQLKIGVQMIGDDFANTPPAHALANRGIVENVAGYTLYGDYAQENPPARIVDEVARGRIDLAVVWGPLAGYFAKREKVALTLVPVSPQIDRPFLPFVYDISMGVRRGDAALRDALEAIMERRRAEIGRILDDYGVPKVQG